MNKKKVMIISDGSCDLNPEIIEKENIQLIHFTISIGDKQYSDDDPVIKKSLFDLVEKYKELPKTAAVSPESYKEIFQKYTSEYDIILIGLGSGFSSSYNASMLAASEFENVYVVDSKNLSAGTGLLVLKACKFRAEGNSAKEIAEKVRAIVPLVRVQFAINTLKYLHMGGRCSGTARLVGTTLRLKPIIQVADGEMLVTKKPIGFLKALNVMLANFEKDHDNIDNDYMTITHCLAEEDEKYLMEQVSGKVEGIKILVTHASCVIASHCGPRTIGILYILKK